MKELSTKLNSFIKNDPTRVRVYLATIFMVIMLYSVKDIPIFQDYMSLMGIFVLTPLVIYLFVKYIFYKKGLDD